MAHSDLLSTSTHTEFGHNAANMRIVREWYIDTLAADLTLDATYPRKIKLDPGGSARDVNLPAEADSDGLTWIIVNGADAAENLVVKDDGGATIATINQFWIV